jgi:deoxyribodipyrimidine photo-lyase
LGVEAVFSNRDYEPAAKARDAAVAAALCEQGIAFHGLKDQAIFDGDEVLTQAGKPYTVFTPYKNAWLKRLSNADCAAHASQGALAASLLAGVPSLAEIGFAETDLAMLKIQPGMSGARALGTVQRRAHPALWCPRDFPA